MACRLLLCGFFLLSPSLLAADPPADAALKRFAERLAEGGDVGRLRQDLLAYRLTHPGTPQAARAAALLAQLPSPLDRIDPAQIPALERFDWQPKELVAVLGEHRGRHGTPVASVAYGPDGKTVVSGGGSSIRVWDTADLRQRAHLGHGGITAVAYSKDGKTLAAAGTTGTVSLWDMTTTPPKLQRTVVAATNVLYYLALAPDGKSLAVGCQDLFVRVVDLTSPKGEKEPLTLGHEKIAQAVAYHPEGKTLATGSADGSVRLWDLGTGAPKLRTTLGGHTGAVLTLAWDAPGRTLASGSADGTVLLWPAGAGPKTTPRTTLAPAGGAVHGAAFASTGALALGCADGTIRLWNVSGAMPRERAKVEGHLGAVHAVAFAPDGKTLATGGADWTCRLWDVTLAKPAQRFPPWSHLSHVYGAALTPDGATLVSGSEDRTLRLWDLTDPKLRRQTLVKGDGIPIYALTLSPDGKRLAYGGPHATVRQYDVVRSMGLRPLPGHPTPVTRLAYAPDGQRLLVAADRAVFWWDAVIGKELQQYTHESPVSCLALSADGRLALSGSGTYERDKAGQLVVRGGQYAYVDCVLRLWDLAEGRERANLTAHKTPVASAAFAPDVTRALSGASDPVFRGWSVEPDGLLPAPPLTGAHGPALGVTFAPDGATLWTRGLEGKLIQWETATGKRLREWTFHENIGPPTYAADGRHLVVPLGTGVVYLLRLAPPSRPRS